MTCATLQRRRPRRTPARPLRRAAVPDDAQNIAGAQAQLDHLAENVAQARFLQLR
jgi:hypothetical protein